MLFPMNGKKIKSDASFTLRLFEVAKDPMIYVKGILRNIRFTNNKDIYWAFIDLKTANSTNASQHYWCTKYELPVKILKKYHYIPYTYTRECKIQSLQFKIHHNIYPCGLKLYHWKIKPSNICLYCDETDNLQHHVYACVKMSLFWSSFEKWWENICPNCNKNVFSELDILLGIAGKCCHKLQLNYMILVAKWLYTEINT